MSNTNPDEVLAIIRGRVQRALTGADPAAGSGPEHDGIEVLAPGRRFRGGASVRLVLDPAARGGNAPTLLEIELPEGPAARALAHAARYYLRAAPPTSKMGSGGSAEPPSPREAEAYRRLWGRDPDAQARGGPRP